jgi:hypothetical protein
MRPSRLRWAAEPSAFTRRRRGPTTRSSSAGGTGVALLAGRFQVSDPLFKRELRLELEDYQVYRVRVGDTRADLTYDRGVMALYSSWEGGDVAVQVLNGRGLEPAGENPRFDRDPWKNVALRYSHELGPLRLGAFGLALATFVVTRPRPRRPGSSG